MKTLIFLMMIGLGSGAFAQKYDFVWLIGDDNNLMDTTRGGTIIDFNQYPLRVQYHYRATNMSISNGSTCDTLGQLLFYTNGCDISNMNDEIIPNGNDLNPGTWHEILCDVNNDGYGSAYPGLLILPKPDSAEAFSIFHQSVNYGNTPFEYAFVDKLLNTSIIKASNGSPSFVIEGKNIPVMIDSLSAGEMNAVKHANGKDWWIIQPRRNSNQFYVFLFTKNGVTDTLIQTIGAVSPSDVEGYGQTTFSPLGDKMIRYYPHNDIRLYAFDRSTGFFTDYSTINLDVGKSIAFDGGSAISPNGRFLYITALTNIYQFDLTAPDIGATQTTVATWDGFVDPIAITFWHCQLGPDCKIYIVGGGDTRYYHIIHNPDEQGLACNVEQRGLVLPTPSGASIPYFPNYRLGPLENPGLPCSPVVATQQPFLPTPGMGIWPNPADTQVNFSSFAEVKTLQIFDIYGRIIKTIPLSGSSETYTLSVQDFAPGVYIWQASSGRGIQGVGRLVVQH